MNFMITLMASDDGTAKPLVFIAWILPGKNRVDGLGISENHQDDMDPIITCLKMESQLKPSSQWGFMQFIADLLQKKVASTPWVARSQKKGQFQHSSQVTSVWNFSESFTTNTTGSKDPTQVIDYKLATSHAISDLAHCPLDTTALCLMQSRVRQHNLRNLGQKGLVGGAF